MRAIIVFILMIGLGLFIYSLSLDYYKDKQAADNLISSSYDIDKSDYYKQEAALRTNKVTFMDLGAGISIASIVLLGFMRFNHIKTISDLVQIKSINKTALFILSNVLWLILIPGTYWYYFFRAGRGDYPPFADSIGIPLSAQVPFLFDLIIPLDLFIGLTMINCNIPTKLFIKADFCKGRAIFWEIFFGFWLLINFFFFVIFVIGGDHISIPVNLFFTYVLLTLRAGKINKWTTEYKINACTTQTI